MLFTITLSNKGKRPVFHKGTLCISHTMTVDVEDDVEREEVVTEFLNGLHSEDQHCEVCILWCRARATKESYTDSREEFSISWKPE
jgi:hypothetical protein